MPAGDVANAEVDQLEGRIRRREMSSCFGDLSQLVIHGLNGVRRVDYLSDCWMELKEGNELLPGSLPGRDQPGVLLAPVVLNLGVSRGLV